MGIPKIIRNTIIGNANPIMIITFGIYVQFLKKQRIIPIKMKIITANVPDPMPPTNPVDISTPLLVYAKTHTKFKKVPDSPINIFI